MVMPITLYHKRVLVTGSEGFVGKHLVPKLMSLGAKDVFTVLHRNDPGQGCNLLNAEYALTMMQNATADGPIDYVFHLAGFNGGISFNLDFPADIFYKNTIMGLNLLRACAKTKVFKVISIVASCAYSPKSYEERWSHTQAKMITDIGVCNEKNFFDGMPDSTVACHGFAKRNLQLATKFYHQQYGLNGICVCPTTMYGPGDSFDPEKTKVMGGMIKRFVDARRKNLPSVKVWGSGQPLREFIYVKDAVELMVRAAHFYNDPSIPLNLGTGQEVTIAELAHKVANIVGYKGNIEYDTTVADGQMRKRLSISRMRRLLGRIPPFTPLEVGIAETAKFYEETYP